MMIPAAALAYLRLVESRMQVVDPAQQQHNREVSGRHLFRA